MREVWFRVVINDFVFQFQLSILSLNTSSVERAYKVGGLLSERNTFLDQGSVFCMCLMIWTQYWLGDGSLFFGLLETKRWTLKLRPSYSLQKPLVVNRSVYAPADLGSRGCCCAVQKSRETAEYKYTSRRSRRKSSSRRTGIVVVVDAIDGCCWFANRSRAWRGSLVWFLSNLPARIWI